MNKVLHNQILKIHGKTLIGALLGFSFFMVATHPKSNVHRKLPRKNIRNFHFFPNIKIYAKNRLFHLHHWFVLSLIYIPIIILKKHLFKYKIIHGFILGGIIQGLTYSDRFSLIK